MSNSAKPPQAVLDQIIGLYNQGELEQTVSLSESLAKQYPNALILYDILGAAYMGLKNTEKTIASYQKALQLNPNHTDAYNNMGMALYDQGRFNEAVESYQNAVKLEPDFADAHYNLGNALKQVGNLKQAIESYKVSLAISPNDTEVILNCGNALKSYGKFDQAIEIYAQALKIDSNSTAAQTNMENAIEEQAEIDKDIADYARITKLEIGSAEMVSCSGTFFKARGYLDAAIDSYNQALKINPDYAEAHYNMGIALKDKGELDAAIDSYKQAIKIRPDYAKAYSNMGVALKDKGELDAAIESCKRAIKIKPDYAEAYNNMGNALKDKGELDAAIDSYKQAIKIKPDNAECFVNCNSVLVQISDGSCLNEKLEANINNRLTLSLYEHAEYQIQKSIQYFSQGDYEASKINLINYKTLDEAGKIKDLTKNNKIFCSTYASFIDQLIKKCPTPQPFNENKIYHVGESHCLSYAHHSLTIQHIKSCISPKITFGAKAYHFSKPEENAFKSITRRNLNNIPNNSLVFVSIGEIDCRINEGFISACQKTGTPLTELVQRTVIGYVKWFCDVNVSNNHRYTFFNVPAPCYRNKFTLDANQDAANVVRLFNEALKKNMEEYSYDLIDVYGPTKADNSFSNGLYYCDNVHLDCSILNIIQDQIAKGEML